MDIGGETLSNPNVIRSYVHTIYVVIVELPIVIVNAVVMYILYVCTYSIRMTWSISHDNGNVSTRHINNSVQANN